MSMVWMNECSTNKQMNRGPLIAVQVEASVTKQYALYLETCFSAAYCDVNIHMPTGVSSCFKIQSTNSARRTKITSDLTKNGHFRNIT